MKKNLTTILLLAVSICSVSAQALLDMVKRDIDVERRAIVAEAMDLRPGTETDFWPLYNEIEISLNALTDKRIVNIKKFADNYNDLTDDIANDLAMVYFDINGSRIKIYKSYYKKVSKILSKKDAARFIQVMDQVQLLIDIQIAAEVPLIK